MSERGTTAKLNVVVTVPLKEGEPLTEQIADAAVRLHSAVGGQGMDVERWSLASASDADGEPVCLMCGGRLPVGEDGDFCSDTCYRKAYPEG